MSGVTYHTVAHFTKYMQKHGLFDIGLSTYLLERQEICYKCISFRKSQLQRDLTPYYACDQTEANVIDGVVYPADSSSVDMICVAEDNEQDVSGKYESLYYFRIIFTHEY